MRDSYKIELFASESEFPDLKSPVQMSFDNRGRLWVSVIPSYPHYKPGDERPNDKILIFEDTNGWEGGQADGVRGSSESAHRFRDRPGGSLRFAGTPSLPVDRRGQG